MNKLSGVITALPTPMNEKEQIDAPGLCKLIDYVLLHGAGGVMLLGTMGEGTSLLDDQKKAAIEVASQHMQNRKPLIATISDTSTKRVIRNARAIEKYAIDYYSTTSTFYYKHPHPESFVRFIKDVSENVNKPLVFYNAPGCTGNPVDVDTLEKILLFDNVAGLKDSSANFHLVMELLRRYPDRKNRPFFITQGDEAMFDVSLLMGADAIVSGGGTCFVSLLVELYNACRERNVIKAHQLQQTFLKKLMGMIGGELMVDWMYRIKQHLAAEGICESHLTAPFLKRDSEPDFVPETTQFASGR